MHNDVTKIVRVGAPFKSLWGINNRLYSLLSVKVDFALEEVKVIKIFFD